jgi:hypothetical protein
MSTGPGEGGGRRAPVASGERLPGAVTVMFSKTTARSVA